MANQSFQQLREVSLTKKKVMTRSQSLSEERSSILIRRFRGGTSKPWETLTSSNGNLQPVQALETTVQQQIAVTNYTFYRVLEARTF